MSPQLEKARCDGAGLSILQCSLNFLVWKLGLHQAHVVYHANLVIIKQHALHLAQNVIVAALEGDMEELTHLRQLCACPNQPLREVPAHMSFNV